MYPIIMCAIGVIVLAILILTIIISRKHQIKVNYRSYFIIGIVWLPVGLAVKNYALAVMGAAFLAAGLFNIRKWRKEPKWSELPPQVRRLKLIIIIFLSVLLLAGIGFFILANNGFLKF